MKILCLITLISIFATVFSYNTDPVSVQNSLSTTMLACEIDGINLTQTLIVDNYLGTDAKVNCPSFANVIACNDTNYPGAIGWAYVIRSEPRTPPASDGSTTFTYAYCVCQIKSACKRGFKNCYNVIQDESVIFGTN